MPHTKLLEIACFTAASALIAQEAGADRIELCDDYSSGGITPAFQTITAIRASLHLPLHVIIRPRGGQFVYSKAEITNMKAAILFCKTQNIQGFVLGALTPDHGIDMSVCKELLALADGMAVTFHRAIDQCADLPTAMQQLIDLGVSRVLTSGKADSAIQGIEVLLKLQQDYGKQITIMPGGGIRSSNISQLVTTGCSEFHSAALTSTDETTDAEEVKKLKQILRRA